MSRNKLKWRKHAPGNISTRPLLVGWVPSGVKFKLMQEGREKELPGYWLYQLQCKFAGSILGTVCGRLFGAVYASRRVVYKPAKM